MPTFDSKPEDLTLEAVVNFEWQLNELITAGFQGAMAEIEEMLKFAMQNAKDLVAPGVGPSTHPHPDPTRFAREDTGKLAEAITYQLSATKTTGGTFVGAPEGRLVVPPIEVDAGNGKSRGPVPYGAYLEFGFTPVMPFRNYVKAQGKRKAYYQRGEKIGKFTKYPFLAPSMYRAAQQLANTQGIYMRRIMVDAARKAKKLKAIKVEERINYAATLGVEKGRWQFVVQPLTPDQDLDDANPGSMASR